MVVWPEMIARCAGRQKADAPQWDAGPKIPEDNSSDCQSGIGKLLLDAGDLVTAVDQGLHAVGIEFVDRQ